MQVPPRATAHANRRASGPGLSPPGPEQPAHRAPQRCAPPRAGADGDKNGVHEAFERHARLPASPPRNRRDRFPARISSAVSIPASSTRRPRLGDRVVDHRADLRPHQLADQPIGRDIEEAVSGVASHPGFRHHRHREDLVERRAAPRAATRRYRDCHRRCRRRSQRPAPRATASASGRAETPHRPRPAPIAARSRSGHCAWPALRASPR